MIIRSVRGSKNSVPAAAYGPTVRMMSVPNRNPSATASFASNFHDGSSPAAGILGESVTKSGRVATRMTTDINNNKLRLIMSLSCRLATLEGFNQSSVL